MEKILIELEKWGCDIKKTLERFVNDKELYFFCLKALCEDEAFIKLGDALGKNNVAEAFDCAHTLKGVIANMGITPMLDIVVKIVEPLRSNDINVGVYYDELLTALSRLNKIVNLEE